MSEREAERRLELAGPVVDPERARLIESWRLARAELERQSAATQHPVRREQIALAIAELERRLEGA